MDAFGAHVEELEALRERAQTTAPWPRELVDLVTEALDGQAAARLRSLVALSDRRTSGAFFTSSALARLLLEGLEDSLPPDPKILDPTCGAGDLLLAAVPKLISARQSGRVSGPVNGLLAGMDISANFVEATRLRLHLSLLARDESQSDGIPQVQQASALDEHPNYTTATNILLNPPFHAIRAPADCPWASGTVNAAAVITLDAIERARPGTEVRLILPDVLRSGSRYRKWRALLDESFKTHRLVRYGRFDRWTDVDVFVMDGHVQAGEKHTSTEWRPAGAGHSVSSFFIVSVGPVVNFRDKHEGRKRPYIVARDLPVWTTVRRVKRKRRWTGPLTMPPFVAIRRTSSPGERERARATIVNAMEPVAIDNHIIVCRPRDGSMASCEALMQVLREPQASYWLNQRIRCRHLTVNAVCELPWNKAEL